MECEVKDQIAKNPVVNEQGKGMEGQGMGWTGKSTG